MPKIIFLSDLHGDLSILDLYAHLHPDLFILCGDICPRRDLITTVPILFTHGNHDSIAVLRQRLPGTYLHLASASIGPLRILGIGGVFTPGNILHSKDNLTSPADLASLLHLPASKVDIIFSHDAPALADPRGSSDLDQLLVHFQPKLWVFGHLHEPITSTHGPTRLVGLSNPPSPGQDLIIDL